MSSWIQVYDSNFFIAIATVVSASFALCLKYAFKSKCENMSFCFGLIAIKRNVAIEKDIEIGTQQDDNTSETSSTKIHTPRAAVAGGQIESRV